MRHKLLALLTVAWLLVPQLTIARSDQIPVAPTAPPLQLSVTEPDERNTAGDASWGTEELPAELRLKFEPSLLRKLLTGAEDDPLRAIVMMREQADVSQMDLTSMGRPSRSREVIRHLQSVAEHSQSSVRAYLAMAQGRQQVVSYRPLWIVNGIAFEGHAKVFWALAARPDVSMIWEDHLHYLPAGERGQNQPLASSAQADPVQWNVQRVKADQVWQFLGLTGEGIVVANMDTGVDWQHPLLKERYRGYAGRPTVEHAGNWYCATNEGYLYPGDGYSHGTHTMGIMVGQQGIGVAPEARWIAVKVFDNTGYAYDSWIHDGFQWILAPNGDPALAPHVVSSSWGHPAGSRQEFLPDVQALRAAGVLPIFSAGNYGPGSGTIASPGSFAESLAVGSLDSNDLIARSSSRGPSPWGEVKPEVSAPGVSIVSSVPGGGLGTKSGTSMAAPHVAGIVALMLQVNPSLTADECETILQQTARPLGEGNPNNDYGWGLVDAYAAVVHAGQLGHLDGQVSDVGTGLPIAHATVRAVSHGSALTVTTTSDASGRYNTGLAADWYDVTASAFGYVPQSIYAVQVITGVTTTLDLSLQALPVGTLQGTVHESGSGAPLDAALSVAEGWLTSASSPVDGTYTFTLPVGTHVVRVEATAHRFVTATVTITSGQATHQDFWLEPAPTILLVDSGAWHNESQIAYYEQALEELRYLYDVHSIASIEVATTDVPTAQTLLPYDLVIWSSPSDSPGYIGAQGAITTYLSHGGQLFLSGQDVAYWDGGGSGASWADYLQSYLKARFVADDAPTRVLRGEEPLFAGITLTIAGPGGADNQFLPDVVASDDPDYASRAWTYEDSGSGGQTVGPCLPYRAVYLSFGFEGINDATARREVLGRSIAWLDGPPQPHGAEVLSGEMPKIQRPGDPVTHHVRLRNLSEVAGDTYTLELMPGAWPTLPVDPASVTLGTCQSVTLEVTSTVPTGTGWHVYDAMTLTARSLLSPTVAVSAVLTAKTPAPVLLVDGSRFYEVDQAYRNALAGAGIPYDYHRVKDAWPPQVPSEDQLATYPVLAWFTAYDWVEPLSPLEETRVITFLDGGGRLFLSSQDYLYHRSDGTLARDYLGVFQHVEDLGTERVWGERSHPISWDTGPFLLTYPYRNWSDGIVPTSTAQTFLRGQHVRGAAITHVGDGWRTAFTGFSFEALPPDAAQVLIGRTVGWLSWIGASSWQADRDLVPSGAQVTMTCVLRNDGWQDIASASFSATLPADLSLVGALSPGAVYHTLTRTVTWQGSLARNGSFTVSFGTQIAGSVPAPTRIPFSARLGYDDHYLHFDRPYVLRVGAPDLSTSHLAAGSILGHPRRVLSYALTVRNEGLLDATAIVTAAAPPQGVFTGTLDSGGIGSGQLITDTIFWIGPVDLGGSVVLSYQVALDDTAEYWLVHEALVTDQTGESWALMEQTWVAPWRNYLPVIGK